MIRARHAVERDWRPGLLRHRANLFHDRVEGTPPVLVRVVHHDVDEDGHEKGEDRGAVAYLIAVDPAVPGRAAVDDLVAKDVEPVEDEAKDADGVPLLEGSPEAALRRPEPIFPVLESFDSVAVLPADSGRLRLRGPPRRAGVHVLAPAFPQQPIRSSAAKPGKRTGAEPGTGGKRRPALLTT